MDILNVQSLVAQGLITDIASIDPNKAYITVGVYQPGNRPAGSGNNTYPSYAISVAEFLATGAVYTASNGINLVGNDFQLASNLISQFTNDVGYLTSGGGTNGLDPVISQTNVVPGSPTLGDRYLAGLAPGAPWTANSIEEWDGVSWITTAPVLDDVVFVASTLSTLRYNGSAWVAYVGTAVLNQGNTVGSTLVIGTNNPQAMAFKTNNIETARVVSGGSWGFGTIIPSAKVSIKGQGSTSATMAFDVRNSASALILAVRNDGNVYSHGKGSVTSNTAFGLNSLLSNVTGGDNTVYGVNAMRINTTGSNNTVIGVSALYNNNGSFNTATGYVSLELNTSGERNTAFGYGSLSLNTTGIRNVAVGMFAGNVNIVGDNNIFIGYNANPSVNNLSNAIAIGYGAVVSSSNSMVLGDNVNVGIGTSSPAAKLHVLQNTVSTGQKGLSINFNTIGEVFYIDDNGVLMHTANAGATFKGSNGLVNIVSNGGTSPTLYFKYNNGASDSGLLYGSGASMFLQSPLFGIGNANFTPSASVHIQGSDSTPSNYALKVDNSASTNLLSIANNGAAVFSSILDGESTGVDNFSSKSTTGGLRTSYYSEAGFGFNFNFFQNSVLRTQITESTGLYAVSVTNRFSLKTLADNKTHLYMGSDGYVGIGGDFFTTSASLHIQGIDATSSNYALKVDNSASTPLLYVRNDGFVGIGTALPTAKLHVLSGDILFEGSVNGTRFNFGGGEDTYIRSGQNGRTVYISDNPNGNVLMASNGGTVAIGNGSVTSDQLSVYGVTRIKGIDATSANYALKVDNSASSPLLYVRNDGVESAYFHSTGKIYMGTSTIGKSGASNGVSISALGQADWVFGFNNGELRTNGVYESGVFMNVTCTNSSNTLTTILNNTLKRWDYGMVADNFTIRGVLNADPGTSDVLIFNQVTGNTSMPKLATSNVGLVTGDMYVDTAANILSNGDKVVGWKV